MALCWRALQKKNTGSNVFKIGGNIHRDYVYCMKLILKKYMQKYNAKLKKPTEIVRLSATILVRSYCFAHIMTREKYVAFKIERTMVVKDQNLLRTGLPRLFWSAFVSHFGADINGDTCVILKKTFQSISRCEKSCFCVFKKSHF